MTHDASVISSIHLLQQSGRMLVPADSGIGNIGRPRAVGPQGGRLATLETFFDFYINNVPMPSEARQLNPNFEQVLRMHPDVSAALEKRTISVSAMPWRIEANPKGNDRKDIADLMADYVRDVMEDIPNMTQVIEHMQYAVLVGGQGLEVVWNRDTTGAFPVEKPVSIHPVHMTRFGFDRLGNMALLTRDTPVWGAYISGDPQSIYNRDLPRGRFIYHQHKQGQGQWDHPEFAGYEYFGIGLDVPLYYVVTFDIYCLKYRMKFLERFGIPPTILYAANNQMMTRDIMRIADSLRGESMVTIPFPMGGTSTGQANVNGLYKVEQMPVPSQSYDFFEGFSDRYTLPRVNAIMLLSSQESKSSDGDSGGGYSDHVSRRDAGPNILFRNDAEKISATLTNQLIPAIVLGRFPGMQSKYWPKFVLAPKEEKDQMQSLQIVQALAKSVPVAKTAFYEAADIAKPEPDDETVGGEQQMMPGQPNEMQKPAVAQAKPGGRLGFPAQPGTPKNGIGDGFKGGNNSVANKMN